MHAAIKERQLTMPEDMLLSFELPAVARKKVTVAFDGGNISSDGGVLLLRQVEHRFRLAERLSRCVHDQRDGARIHHTIAEMLRLRTFAIAAGYPDADDCDTLRHDPAFKMAVGRTPESGAPLCSQPTMSRLENAPSRIAVSRMMLAMVHLFLDSFRRAPKNIVLDIDDTLDAVHGGQQLALFNAHYDERCFLPIHIYEGITGKPVAVILRAGKTPTGQEVRTILKHLIGRIRARWPEVKILVRGDSHYGRIEAMDWCEDNGVDYIFGFAGNPVLHAMVRSQLDAVCVHRAVTGADKVRDWCTVWYAAKTWRHARRVVARIEASTMGSDTRFVVTSLAGTAIHLYEDVYCTRGQAENLIKLHKAQLASDRTSCHSATANQFRLILHTCAYWLMYGLRAKLPACNELARAEFATLRLRLIKVAARVIEKAARIRIQLSSACVDKKLFRALAVRLHPQPP